jgi:hypothetical protein
MMMSGWVVTLIVVLAFVAFSLVSNLREIRLIFRGASKDDSNEGRLDGGRKNKRLKK